jgi:drug/metabolite transporter (DMT)-like permease
MSTPLFSAETPSPATSAPQAAVASHTASAPPASTAAHRWAVALVFIMPLLWTVNYVVGRQAPGVVAPHMLALLRWALAGLILLAFAWPELQAKRALLWRKAWHYVVLGALGMWICGAWVYIGARTTVATNIALLYALSPVFIALISALWLREKLGKLQWLGIALAFAGMVHVVIKGHWVALAQVQFVVGDLWILACTVSWTVYSILLRRWPTEFSPLARLVLIIAGGVAVLLPLAILEAWSGLPMTQTLWGWKATVLIVAAAVMPGAGAYLAYSTIQKELGAARAALTLYLGPLYAALVAWVFLGESVQAYHAVGALAILPGIYLASRSKA